MGRGVEANGMYPEEGRLGPGAETPTHILVIDDNPAVLDGFKKILMPGAGSGPTETDFEALEEALFGSGMAGSDAALKFDVDTVSSGEAGREAALQALRAGRPYAVVFVDMRMPDGWDGLETIEALWRVDADIQMVICTAYADYSWRAIIDRLGQSDRLLILRKPFEPIEVLQLANALSHKWLLHREHLLRQKQLENRVMQSTDELLQQQQLERHLLENLAEGVIACDTSSRLILFNEVARRWHGVSLLPPERDIQRDYYTPDGSPLPVDEYPLVRALRGEILSGLELILMAEEQPRRWVLVSGGPIRDVQGRCQGAIVILHDITESYSLARRFAGLFEWAPDAILMSDQQGKIVQINRQAEAMFGWRRGELLGKPVEVLMPQSLAEGHREYRRDYMRAPRPRMMGRDRGGGLSASRRDGTVFPVDISFTPIDTGDDRLIAVFVRDISQRLYSEQAMREAMAMLNALDDCAFIFDPGTLCFSYANEGAVRMLGYTRDELRVMTPIDICPKLDEQAFRRRLKPLLDNETGSLNLITLFQHRSGSRLNVEINLQCVLMNSSDFRFVALARDVTERENVLKELRQTSDRLREANQTVARERERLAQRVEERTTALRMANRELAVAKREAERANHAKSAFLATMSHEIRTPMNGVVGMIEVLAQSPLNEQQVDAVDTIRESALSLLAIIDDVLDFSKIEAGQLQLERVEVRVPEIVEGVVGSLLPLAQSKGVDLSLYIDPAVPERQWSDPTRLRQILVNLVGNAVKFSSGRDGIEGRVQVRLDLGQDASRQMEFSIIDNGIGMSGETRQNLFQSFTQAEISTTRRFGGTGLGLAICKRLVDVMQGQIEVESRLGKGSRFRVALPVEAVTTEAAASVHPRPLEGVEILLVAEHEFDAEAAAAYLAQAGAVVEQLSSRDEALRQAQALVAPIILYCNGDRAIDPAQLSRDGVHLPQLRQLVVGRTHYSSAWESVERIRSIEALPLRRRALLKAVAGLSGRTAPEAVSGERQARRTGQRGLEVNASSLPILIAEDDVINQKVILKQLELLGYRSEIAENGQEALRLWRRQSYGLILTDLHMPEMDGYELAESIRREEQGTHIPIVALTANAVRGEESRALQAGMDAYLTKPVQLAVLEPTLNSLLKGRETYDGGVSDREGPHWKP